MKVTVIGAGYVGLVTAACLAEQGNHVLCIDANRSRIGVLEQCGMPLHEAGLAELVSRNRARGRLLFSCDLEDAAAQCGIQFIAVGTPPNEDGSADLQYVLEAARTIGRRMDAFQLVINKSTVPVGTAALVRSAIQAELNRRGVALKFAVVSNPEFLKEGSAVHDFMHPDRILIGCEEGPEGRCAAELMASLYAPFDAAGDRILWMDTRSAELSKYAANAMLATRISFMNEVANLADALGADVEAVRRGIGSDRRIGHDFLRAGCGYGGSCFPKDVQALCHMADGARQPLLLVRAVEAVNQSQQGLLGMRLQSRFGDDLRGRRFALWGLAFKPDTDDMRRATSHVLLRQLLRAGAQVVAYDPVARNEAERTLADDPLLSAAMLARLSYAPRPLDALRGADALLVVTEWREFGQADLAGIKALLRQPVVFDGRNVFDPNAMARAGFEYHGIGRAVHTRVLPTLPAVERPPAYLPAGLL